MKKNTKGKPISNKSSSEMKISGNVSHSIIVQGGKNVINKKGLGDSLGFATIIGIVAIVAIIAFAIIVLNFYKNLTTPLPTENVAIFTSNNTDEHLLSPKEFVDSKGVAMALVASGKFLMGSDQGNIDAQPSHSVYLDAYYMDIYETTNSEYRDCMDSGACSHPGETTSYPDLNNYYENSSFDNYPVININWYMAASYCSWRGARLPTEAEWENAARGTDSNTFPWGNNFLCNKGNFDDETEFDVYTVSGGANCDTYRDISPVGSFENGRSLYGIYDMAGNVWEWVADYYSGNYYTNSPSSNPAGPSSGQYKVLRGGSWAVGDEFAKSFTRHKVDPLGIDPSIGVRCVSSAP
jgi:formylglycine-generating enzyme required for sulfatase activity